MDHAGSRAVGAARGGEGSVIGGRSYWTVMGSMYAVRVTGVNDETPPSSLDAATLGDQTWTVN